MSLAGLLDVEVRYVLGDGGSVVTVLRDVDLDRVVRGLPVRNPAARVGQRHYSGLFWSVTTGGHVPYESRLELDRLWLADVDPRVCEIAAQPLWLGGRDGPAVRRHAPDLLLARDGGGCTVVDVKSARLASRPEDAAVLAWTGRLCAARGWRYEVWTGGSQVLLSNVRWLGQPAALRSSTRALWSSCGAAGVQACALVRSLPGARVSCHLPWRCLRFCRCCGRARGARTCFGCWGGAQS